MSALVRRPAAVHDRGVRHGRWRITVESAGGRQRFRLLLGESVMADNVASVAELERELARYGLTLDQFEPED